MRASAPACGSTRASPASSGAPRSTCCGRRGWSWGLRVGHTTRQMVQQTRQGTEREESPQPQQQAPSGSRAAALPPAAAEAMVRMAAQPKQQPSSLLWWSRTASNTWRHPTARKPGFTRTSGTTGRRWVASMPDLPANVPGWGVPAPAGHPAPGWAFAPLMAPPPHPPASPPACPQVRQLASGLRVLDLCCYAGGFALSAAAGGAGEVLGVDSSAPAVELAARNAALNGWQDVCSFVRGDVTEFMKQACACVCVCVRARVCVCECVRVCVPTAHVMRPAPLSMCSAPPSHPLLAPAMSVRA